MSEETNEEKIEEEAMEEIGKLTDIMVKMAIHLHSTYPDDEFHFKLLPDQIRDIAEVTVIRGDAFSEIKEKFKFDKEVEEKQIITFWQLLDNKFTEEENNERVVGSYERNLRSAEKLGEEQMEKHGQLIMHLYQAEVKSIKTVKEIEKKEE